MLITIPDVFTAEEVAQARAILDAADWVDGKVTAGYQAQSVKANLQLPEGHPVAVKLGEMVLGALDKANKELGLALADDEIDYLVERYADYDQVGFIGYHGRQPTPHQGMIVDDENRPFFRRAIRRQH